MFRSDGQTLFEVDHRLDGWIRQIRRHIHADPELSFQEFKTARFIAEKLAGLGIEFEEGIAGTGIVATLPGQSGNSVGVALRADMDGLPIIEETGLAFASRNSGIMHSCGHDGHVAMLLGAAALLHQAPLPGPVKLLFQPAEEHGNGAHFFVEAGVLKGIDQVFAGHIDTHFPVGTITVDEGIICAWADPFSVRIVGRSGHAARPHEAIDAVVASANLVLSVQTLISRGVDPNHAAVVTIGSVQAGTAHNIIAGEALLGGTIRSTNRQSREMVIEGLRRTVSSIADMHRVEATLDFLDSVPAVVNDRRAVENARVAASRTAGLNAIVSQGKPSLGAEDFAFYQQQVPGCLVRFGASRGESAGVSHSGTFDFSEDVLALGASWYANAAWQALHRRSDLRTKL